MGFLSKFAIAIVMAVLLTTGIGMLFTSMYSSYSLSFGALDVSSQMSDITNKTANFQQQMETAITTIDPFNFIATTVLTPISLLFSFIDMFTAILSEIIESLTSSSFMPQGKINGQDFNYMTLIYSAIIAIIAIRIGKTVVDTVFKSDM